MPVAEREETVMIVDDVPENLALLGAILRKEKYNVEVFTSGLDALKATEENPPDIVLLDICMPDIDGYEVCQKLKADPELERIPVLFISALTQVQEKVKGFEVGGQDYVTKPFEVREVIERVRTHLELAWTRRELEITLDQTLTGSIKVITDFMGIVNPNAFSRGIRIKQNMTSIVDVLKLEPKRWFELAAVLSQLGVASLPQTLQEKYSCRKTLSAGEKEEVDNSIELVAAMLKSIPRLEPVAEMINHHNLTQKITGDHTLEQLDVPQQGGMVLSLLHHYDQLALEGLHAEEVIEILRDQGEHPEVLYDALESMAKVPADWKACCLAIAKLEEGMILQEDIVDKDGRTLLKQGVKFSNTIIKALKFQVDNLPKKSIMIKYNPTLHC